VTGVAVALDKSVHMRSFEGLCILIAALTGARGSTHVRLPREVMTESQHNAPEAVGVGVETETVERVPERASAAPTPSSASTAARAPSGNLGLQIEAPTPGTLDATRGSTRRHTLGLGIDLRKPEPVEVDVRTEAHAGVFGRALPAEYLTDPRERLDIRDRVVLERLEQVAYFMDDLVPIPGTRFRLGLDPLIGLIPFAGDVVTCAISIYFLIEGIRLGARPGQLLRMTGNIALDVTLGLIPLIGDVFDTLFKANARNLEIIRDEVLGFARVEEPEDVELELPPLDATVDATGATAAAPDRSGETDADSPAPGASADAAIIEDEDEDDDANGASDASDERAEVKDDTEGDGSDRAEVDATHAVVSSADARPTERPALHTAAPHVPVAASERRVAEAAQLELVNAPTTPSALVRQPSTTMSKVVGYALIGGLISAFFLPWAIFLYLVFRG